MKQIKAYKCNYCKKIYENKLSCKSHENKCYFNPITRSCAGCAFLMRTETKMPKGGYYQFNVCLVNHDIFRKLLTKCPDFVGKNEEQSILLVESARSVMFDEQRSDSRAKSHFKQLHLND